MRKLNFMSSKPREDSLVAARHMISRYGENVLQEVELRISELKDSGYADAHQLWVDIRGAVMELIQ